MWAVFYLTNPRYFYKLSGVWGNPSACPPSQVQARVTSFFSVTRAFNLTIDDSSLIVTELGHGLLAVSCEGLLISLLVIKFIAVCFVIEVKGRYDFSDF